jgi:tetratricopeptide (TPR) repeat protein
MKMKLKHCILLITVLPSLLCAQSAEEYRLLQEQRRRAELMRTLDSAITLMEEGNYQTAEEKMLHVLNNIRSVPSDLTFYFGKNSFFLKKYKQSVDWLSKYLQLKGTAGQFYSEALDLLRKAENEVRNEQRREAEKAKQILSANYEIDCGPAGKVMCPICKGTTVLVKRGSFGNHYSTCPYCDKHGFLTCEEYNKLIRGELTPRE